MKKEKVMIFSTKLAVNFDDIQKNKRAIIVDNFYKDPDAVREYALQQEFFEGDAYVGRRTNQQFLFPGLRDSFQSIIGSRITKWEEYGMNGRFQHNNAGDPLVYHADGQRWAGMIYLTPDAPPWSGTNMLRHRETKIHHTSQVVSDMSEIFNQKTFLDPSPYETVDKFGNIYNRLTLFDGNNIHAAGGYFGWDKESARLWHMFFFDTEI